MGSNFGPALIEMVVVHIFSALKDKGAMGKGKGFKARSEGARKITVFLFLSTKLRNLLCTMYKGFFVKL